MAVCWHIGVYIHSHVFRGHALGCHKLCNSSNKVENFEKVFYRGLIARGRGKWFGNWVGEKSDLSRFWEST